MTGKRGLSALPGSRPCGWSASWRFSCFQRCTGFFLARVLQGISHIVMGTERRASSEVVLPQRLRAGAFRRAYPALGGTALQNRGSAGGNSSKCRWRRKLPKSQTATAHRRRDARSLWNCTCVSITGWPDDFNRRFWARRWPYEWDGQDWQGTHGRQDVSLTGHRVRRPSETAHFRHTFVGNAHRSM